MAPREILEGAPRNAPQRDFPRKRRTLLCVVTRRGCPKGEDNHRPAISFSRAQGENQQRPQSDEALLKERVPERTSKTPREVLPEDTASTQKVKTAMDLAGVRRSLSPSDPRPVQSCHSSLSPVTVGAIDSNTRGRVRLRDAPAGPWAIWCRAAE